jgi:hypothetical protein
MQSSETLKQTGDTPVTGPIIGPGHTYGTVTEKISAIVLSRRTT